MERLDWEQLAREKVLQSLVIDSDKNPRYEPRVAKSLEELGAVS